MGLGNSSHAIYLSIVDGKISRRYKTAMEGITTSRTTNRGKLVHEQYFDHISGFIVGLEKKTHPEFGEFININIIDGDERFQLQTNIDGGYGRAFLKLLPNIDFSKRTTIIPSMKMEEEKKKVTMFVNQQGVSGALKHFFTFENKKGMPDGVKTRYKGKDVYDYTDQINFLWGFYETNIKNKLKGLDSSFPSDKAIAAAGAGKATDKADNSAGSVSDAQYEDDLPF
jgi:hypothetical protein